MYFFPSRGTYSSQASFSFVKTLHSCQGVHGHIDRRRFNGRGLTLAGMSVEQFFLELYHSAAESLPEMEDCAVAHVDWSIDLDESSDAKNHSESRVSSAKQEASVVFDWDPGSTLLKHQLELGSGERLPIKYIQHSKPIDLWWLYLAWVSLRCPAGTAAACWATFWRRWSAYWCFCLGLRKATQHAQCNECAQHSLYIHCSSAGPQDKRIRALAWQKHLREQYHDRLIYWHLRWWSTRPDSNILVIIIDGMDKSKGKWPQYTFRVPHMLEKFHRPRLTMHLAMAHGYTYDFYIADDEDFFHGASFFCEILIRSLAKVKAICTKRGKPMPEHLIVQADNTTAQAKNEEVAKLLAVLVGQFRFKTAILEFLRVGHTHEDVDFMFSLLLARVLRKVRFQVPAELCRAILAGMGPVVQNRHCELGCHLLSHVRDFNQWMSPLRIHMYNCWVSRNGIVAPHSFTFKLRMDFPTHERLGLPRQPREVEPHECDVFCVTKTYMSSQEPNGLPVLVVPYDFLSRLQQCPQGTCYSRSPMADARRGKLREFAAALEAFTHEWSAERSYFRAARELRVLADGRDAAPSLDGYLAAAAEPRGMPIELSALASALRVAWYLVSSYQLQASTKWTPDQGKPLLQAPPTNLLADAGQIQ